MNKCKKCGRPLTKNEPFCTHCKTKMGNLAGKIGGILTAIVPIVLLVAKKKK
ncbi:TPA: hypothetical protein ACGW54_003954 [Bacillus tropicus]